MVHKVQQYMVGHRTKEQGGSMQKYETRDKVPVKEHKNELS
jgi:hypothetical protein